MTALVLRLRNCPFLRRALVAPGSKRKATHPSTFSDAQAELALGREGWGTRKTRGTGRNACATSAAAGPSLQPELWCVAPHAARHARFRAYRVAPGLNVIAPHFPRASALG